LSALMADYYFVDPIHSFFISNPADQISLLIFVVVGSGMALLGDLHRRAVERADREALLRRDAELAERAYRQRFEATLASIGDAVIPTDAGGRVYFNNEFASSLIGWKREQVLGMPLESIFRIVSEETREPVENPALRAMQEGHIFELANHTILVSKDGTEKP